MKNRGGKEFFKVAVTADVLRAFRDIAPLETEEVPFQEARGRVLGAEVAAEADLPPFDRAIMDGYAVRASDTFGCGESQPAYLACERTVEMGTAAGAGPAPGEALRISTGGMMPSGMRIQSDSGSRSTGPVSDAGSTDIAAIIL